MSETATVPTLESLPQPSLPRRRELIFGTAFITGGVVIAMATLIGMYLSARTTAISEGVGWLAENNIPLTQPNMMLVTLGMSVVTMQWAVYAINRDDRYHTYMALGLTVLFGIAFINQASFLFGQVALELTQPEGPYFYAVTAGHLAMTVVGLIFIILMAFRALGGQFSSRQPDGIAAAALFWYASVAVYAVLWLAIYIHK